MTTAINGSETRAMFDEAVEIQRGAWNALVKAEGWIGEAEAAEAELRTKLEQVQPSLETIDLWAAEWKETAGIQEASIDFAREYALESRLTLQQLIDYEAYLMEISDVKVPAPRQTVPLLAISIVCKLKDLKFNAEKDFFELYPYPNRVEVIDGEIAIFQPYPMKSDINSKFPHARFNTPDGSIRFPLSDAEEIWDALPADFHLSDEFRLLVMDCGF